ncbi:(2R)-3-sulfolactate dehydrogenase (NADP+) [Rhizobiales bacterium GAS188]|nr:(2R)-3-sulfolactate dehydrogenase (NADP+) [Rhizobiales bacterium GAS188]
MPVLTLEQIESLSLEALGRAGAGDLAARSVARSVRRAEADGLRPIGLGFLPTYLVHLASGKVDGGAVPLVARPRPATVTVDAAHGFAHPAFDAGLDPLIAAARACGTASLAISRSYSIGVLGHPVEDIAKAGLVAIAVTNGPPNIAPWGGRTPLFGTNPMAFAVPRRSAPPLIIDQAASVATKVALLNAAKTGEAIPAGWAFDAEGHETRDPQAALKGSMAAFGGAKGANLALLVDLLAGGLTGANFSKDASPYGKADGPPPGVGQLFIAFAPDAFAPGFLERVEEIATAMLAQDGVRLPGDRRLAARARIALEGVAVPDELLASIAA